MKKYLLILIMLVTLQAYSQKYTTIKGNVQSDRLKKVELYKTVDGAPQLCASTDVAPDGTYGFLFVPETPGFYLLGGERMNFLIYAKGGEQVNIDLLENQAKLNGKNSKENIALYKWQDYAANIRLKSVYFDRTQSNFEDFFPEFKTFIAGIEPVKKSLKSGNPAFDETLRKMIGYETDYYAVMFLQTPRTKHPERSDRPEYYSTIVSGAKFVNDEIMQHPYGVRMAGTYASFAQRESGKPYDPATYTETCMAALRNDRLKGEYILTGEFERYKSYDQYLKGMDKFGKYFVTPSLKARAEAIGTKLYETRSGGMAADFTYPDANGRQTSLSDFKGKVVLVDVWATWCGPCRGEIPSLKKLETEMHGTDVVFIGVSVDEAKDKQKWLDFIKKEELGGIQLLASGWSKITKDYKINGIPRFMVFDRKGNIVSVDAPRPSNPELKKMLEAELKK